MPFLLRAADLRRVERERRAGVTSREVVEAFAGRGARLSAATFRKYVQAGLLPRSRRVGHKGKHTGSTGLYPVSVIRRIDLIKRMMAEGLTLEDIRESFVALKHRLEEVQGDWDELVTELVRRARTHPRRREVERELTCAEREMRSALRRIERVGGRIATVRPPQAVDTG
ncbi:MAG TPA: MerR family transcriptional regulator [Anaeromyxobacteraceae bacterium]|nr:MerR family transcriptional regulator [Anaeromyxobacteraceae bacterium]